MSLYGYNPPCKPTDPHPRTMTDYMRVGQSNPLYTYLFCRTGQVPICDPISCFLCPSSPVDRGVGVGTGPLRSLYHFHPYTGVVTNTFWTGSLRCLHLCLDSSRSTPFSGTRPIPPTRGRTESVCNQLIGSVRDTRRSGTKEGEIPFL